MAPYFNAIFFNGTKMILRGIVSLLVGLGVALIVSACQSSDDPSAMFDNIYYRLSNSLDVSTKILSKQNKTNQTALIRYPSLKQQSYSIAPTNVNLIEFLELSSCDLQRHIGQRNSSLGRFMKASHVLAYEYQFILLAEQCLTQLEQGSALYKVLEVALLSKKENLERVQWNAVFASDEFATLFSLGTKALTLGELKSKPSNLYSALETVQLFIENKIDDQVVIEDAYAVIASSKYMGQLRLSMNMSTEYLKRANQLLAYRVETKALCFKQRANPQFDIVNTVFMKFYIGEVQPYIALLHQQSSTLLGKIDALIDSLKAKPEFEYFWGKVYLNGDSEWQLFDQELKIHTQYWQKLLSQCGRLPSV